MHRLKVIRERKKISSRALASAVGVSTATISRVERRLQDPSLSLVRRLCAYFKKEGLTAEDFVETENAA